MSGMLGFFNAGTASLRAGELSSAVSLLRQATEAAGPEDLTSAAWKNLGIALRRSGEDEQALQAFNQALGIDPDDVEAIYSLGNTHMAMGRHREAIAAFQRVRTLTPTFAKAANNEGAAWMALSQSARAEACFLVATELDPESGQAWANLGSARAAMGRHAAPLHALQKALALDPTNHTVRVRLGHLLTELGHFEAAIMSFRTVLSQEPTHACACAGLTLALHRQGDTIGALACIAPAIASGTASPDEAIAYARICIHMGRPADAIEVIERCLCVASQPATCVILGKQLGQLLDANGQTDAAFAAIAEANALRGLSFNAERHTAQIDAIITSHDPSALQSSVLDETPVFIVGMPRSGTTLIEQMLDAHPMIFGAGERGELKQIAARMLGERLGVDTLDSLAQAYLSRIRPLAPDAHRITDKMPDNFLVLGQAAQLFPRARVIHCTRDPADTGLSVLFQHFKDTLPWATRQDDIAAYLDNYRRLMDHWAINLRMRMLTVPYEALVADPDAWARRLASFLCLPFDEAMLHPEHNARVVRTASFDQVRRPIHTRSVGRSDAYQDHIPTLIDLRCDRLNDGPFGP